MPTLADVLRQTGYSQDGELSTPTPTQPTMASMWQQHLASLPQTTLQNLEKQRQDIDKALVMTPQGMQIGDQQAFNDFVSQAPNVAALTAWHGTPHKIQGNFDISKVGTGEGAQAYGHGMYFAENPAVAKEYQKMLAGPEQTAAEYLKMYKTPEQAISVLQSNITPNLTAEAKKFSQDTIDVLKSGKELKGNLYKVDIPDEHIPNMLDWDKPLTEQTPQVRKALESIGIKTDKQKLNEFDDALLAALTGDASTPLPKEPMNSMGSAIYQTVLRGTPEAKSAKLRELGITGIRYLDEGSRSTGKGTSNFVVFNPSTVKILEENGKPLSRKELIEQQVNKVLE